METQDEVKILRFACLRCRHKFTQPRAQYAISQSLEQIVIAICPACASDKIIFSAQDNEQEHQPENPAMVN